MSALISATRDRCAPVSAKASAFVDLGGERARADDASGRRAPLAAGADQRDRELVREQLVIGETFARRVGGRQIRLASGRMGMAQGIGPAGPAAPFPERRVDPFGKLGGTLERCCRGALHLTRREACRQRMDWLDRLQAVELVGAQHQVGVRHLRHAVVELDPAADDPLGADRKQARQIVTFDVEVDEG